MPNYLQTVIYKIEHKENKELVYVGSTTNFYRRKSQHKSNCKKNTKNYKLYTIILENGGWKSFEMLEIKKFPCNNKRESEVEEERCRIELKATMNTHKAFVAETKQEYDRIWYNDNRDKIAKQKIAYREAKKHQRSIDV